ncbi:MAG: glycosyltransferase family 4 protein [candidate division KSB1 bacterium]|nr:glycosyltransferase family 4 protein [candidate division KSB1 bacterium]MDZ7341189.1 glycosyltransferase family 4 protein [candidate division KSB1 bacterium]
MKILMANKFYFIKGGSERYYFELTKVLHDHGHTVIPFSMKHPRNFSSEYSDYFVDNIEFNLDSGWEKLKNSPRIAGRILYSMHARKKIEQLIEQTRPDIAHLHMIDHQMSPSILHSLRKYKIPVLLTAHQLKVVCPNYRLFNWNTKQVCEKCLHGNYFYPIIEKCHKNSRLAGLLLTLETYLHKLLRLYENYVDIFHVPSKFYGRKFVEAGIPSHKVQQLYYTIRIDDYMPQYEADDYYVYFGRLEEAKGLLTLLQAAEQVRQSQLWLIGEGYYRQELEAFAAQRNLRHVKFLGGKWGEDLKKIISRAKFVIIPSECYDNSPLVVYEAYAMGKPVIGSDIGGIPELIDHQTTGLLFPPGNSEALAEKIGFLLEHPQLVREYGQNARAKAEREFSPQVHYEKIYQLYQNLVNGN